MGYKKPTGCSADHLAAAKFPNHGSTYTVIRHKFLIDASRSLLKTHGFDIVNEEYKATGFTVTFSLWERVSVVFLETH